MVQIAPAGHAVAIEFSHNFDLKVPNADLSLSIQCRPSCSRHTGFSSRQERSCNAFTLLEQGFYLPSGGHWSGCPVRDSECVSHTLCMCTVSATGAWPASWSCGGGGGPASLWRNVQAVTPGLGPRPTGPACVEGGFRWEGPVWQPRHARHRHNQRRLCLRPGGVRSWIGNRARCTCSLRHLQSVRLPKATEDVPHYIPAFPWSRSRGGDRAAQQLAVELRRTLPVSDLDLRQPGLRTTIHWA